MNKKGITILMLVACFTLLSISALAVTIDNRLFGADRYKTAEAIAEAYNAGTVDSVVLVPGNTLDYKNNQTARCTLMCVT